MCFRSVKVSARTKVHNAIPNHPTRQELVARRKLVKVAYYELPEAEGERRATDPLLYLPPRINTEALDAAKEPGSVCNIGPEIDPVKLVHSISIVQHLRSTRFFEEVLEDTAEYFALESALVVRELGPT